MIVVRSNDNPIASQGIVSTNVTIDTIRGVYPVRVTVWRGIIVPLNRNTDAKAKNKTTV